MTKFLTLCVFAAAIFVLHERSANADNAKKTVQVDPAEKEFLVENDAAMTKMMKDMNVKPTGDVDRDFVAMMVPHHQGAIDMARAVLAYGKNVPLRRLAQEIIVTQQEEISAMRLAVEQPLPPSFAAPTQIKNLSNVNSQREEQK